MGILQAIILEWVAISSTRGSSQPRDRTQVSRIAGGFFTSWTNRKPKDIGMGTLSLLQQIFLTQELNWGLLHCRWILCQLSYRGSQRPIQKASGNPLKLSSPPGIRWVRDHADRADPRICYLRASRERLFHGTCLEVAGTRLWKPCLLPNYQVRFWEEIKEQSWAWTWMSCFSSEMGFGFGQPWFQFLHGFIMKTEYSKAYN